MPSKPSGQMRFNAQDIDNLSHEVKENKKYSAFDILLQNWGTMKEWGEKLFQHFTIY